MSKLRWMMCGVLLAVTACADAPSAPAPTDEADMAVIASRSEMWNVLPPRSTAETCTFTEGPCKRGQCERGANDVFAVLTEVCCNANGVCTTERYRICGC